MAPFNPVTLLVNSALSNPAQLAILRALRHTKEGLSGRGVARAADLNHQTCATALQKLEDLGFIERQGSGQSQLLRLNPNNVLIEGMLEDLFEKETEVWKNVLRQIETTLQNVASSVVLFGSVARGTSNPTSDIDLVIETPSSKKAQALDLADLLRRSLKSEYGLRLSPLVISENEKKRRIQRGDPLLKNIQKEGIELLSKKGKQKGS